jgi:hypothetical protein
VIGFGEHTTEIVGVTDVIISVTGADVVALRFESAAIVAVIAWVPTGSVEMLPMAIPPEAVRTEPAVET